MVCDQAEQMQGIGVARVLLKDLAVKALGLLDLPGLVEGDGAVDDGLKLFAHRRHVSE